MITFNPDGSALIAAPNGNIMSIPAGLLPSDIAAAQAAFFEDNPAPPIVPTPSPPPPTDPALLAAIAKCAPLARAVVPMGTFTIGVTAMTVVLQPAIQANSVVILTPLNVLAAQLQWFIATITPGVSFAVGVNPGALPKGTEAFAYVVLNP
jgi:hypothetical protein